VQSALATMTIIFADRAPTAHGKDGMEDETTYRTPVAYDQCSHVNGPFFHGTQAALKVGADLVPGNHSHFRPGRALLHVYFTALVETAVWGAELAAALHPGGGDGLGPPRERIYVVEPQGPFEDDRTSRTKSSPATPRSPTAPPTRCASWVSWTAGRVTPRRCCSGCWTA